MFESFRENKVLLYKRPDSNIFGTVSVGYLLKSLKPFFSEKANEEIDKILVKMEPSFPFYENKDGLKTYNFWQTKPSQHFPSGYFMKHFRHFKLPDDIDDTALVYMTKGYSKKEVNWLKEKLKEHAFPDKVYSTWFGVDMPLERDVCALCNLMSLLLDAKLELNEHDKATIDFLNSTVVSKDFLKNTFWVSRHYATVPLIIYHYARLLGQFEIDEMAESRRVLIDLIPGLFKTEKVWMNKVLLQTAYLKFNENLTCQLVEWNALDESNINSKEFYSFIGAPFAPLKNKYLKQLGSKKVFQIGWKCEAHELALVLENLVLRENYLIGKT
ncbi:hypothetical protein DJ013_19250 [Arcticibacterium luteifluviistationis]|uniref:Uncharacterized protein n=2 Tax=Arcticibacterium luteifluviistationis TaxID=1784714 RepID=A0A2Z4GG13_9BACT|nr:hypothetical protein DJ013_19250 [Arcticibacterium luteifluviistationis]